VLAGGLPSAEFPMAQTSSNVAAPDQSKLVLQTRAVCRASSSILQQKHSCFLGDLAIQ